MAQRANGVILGNSDMLVERRHWLENRMTPADVAGLLNVTEKTLRTLPLTRYLNPQKTVTGIKGALCYQLPMFVAFLQNLTPSYATYNPIEGPLLSPEQVAVLAHDNGVQLTTRKLATLRKQRRGPVSVAIGPRAHRYRQRDVLRWIVGQQPASVSELIMQEI